MKLSVIPLHSFVDIITNSSSELFVCSADKTVKAVKEILQEIADTHKVSLAFNSMFGKIYLSKITSQSCPEWTEYKKLHEYNRKHPLKEECVRQLQIWMKDKSHVQSPTYSEKGDQQQYERERQAYWEAERAVSDSIYLVWNQIVNDNHRAWVSSILKQSELDPDLLGKSPVVDRWGTVNYEIDRKSPEGKILEQIELVMSWSININKGDILIHSKDDNSIPYEMWDDINSTLGGSNYHCC